jgi:TonB family protein
VLQSILNWHFSRESAGMRRQVTIGFDPAATGPSAVPMARTGVAVAPSEDRIRALEAEATLARQQAREAEANRAMAMVAELRKQAEAARQPRQVQKIEVLGLPDNLRTELMGKLPVHVGDMVTAETMAKAEKIVREFDEHMSISMSSMGATGTATLTIGSPEGRALARMAGPATTPERIRVGGNIAQAKLVRQARPAYPVEAKQARIQGVVQLMAVIAKDGTILSLEVQSGHPMLVPAALEAVRQWVYEPTLLNGNPVEVITQIDVNFTLAQ